MLGQIFGRLLGFGGPEAIGLMILGATIGAVAGGAGSGVLLAPAFGAGIGALVLPALVCAPWSRLRLGEAAGE